VDNEEILSYREKLDKIKYYVKAWRSMDYVKWEPGMLGADKGARHDVWLAGLEEILEDM
jgi:hypothetical protein